MSYINANIIENVTEWTVDAYHNGKFTEVSVNNLLGRWSVFFFYPADFTFVCPTELADLQDHYPELQALGVDVYGVSTDTHFVHKAWADASDTINRITYPLIGDASHRLTGSLFAVLDHDTGLAKRSTFVIDPDGKIVIVEMTSDGIGRNAAELVRKIKAAIYTREHPGEACPAKWVEGSETLTPSLDLVGKI